MIKILGIICFFYLNTFAAIDFKSELDSLKMIGNGTFDKKEKVDYVFVDFWASWCDPCKESFPFYEAKLKSAKKKIRFISVNLDDKIEKATAFLKEFPQSHPTVWDKERKFMNLLNFDAIPYLLILDKDWKQVEAINGFNNKTKKKIEKYLE